MPTNVYSVIESRCAQDVDFYRVAALHLANR